VSGLADAVGDVAGVATGQLWKVATIVLLLVGLVLGAAGGTAWWLAAAARDKALVDLKAEQGVSAELRAGVNTQNTAILAQAKLAREAEARGKAAQEREAANARRFDAALASAAGQRATTCAEAMPVVNRLLEQVR
jgi:hypothetical protein